MKNFIALLAGFFVAIFNWCYSFVHTFIFKVKTRINHRGLKFKSIGYEVVRTLRQGAEWLYSWLNQHQLYRCL